MLIKVEMKGVKELMQSLQNEQKKIALTAAIACNRAADSCRAEAVRLMRSEYTARAMDVRKSIGIKKATTSNPQAEVDFQRTTIPLIAYQTKGKGGPARKTKKGIFKTPAPVQVAVRKGSWKVLPKAFIRTMRFGKKVFKRIGKEKLDITGLAGPSVGGVVKANIQRIKTYTQKRLNSEFLAALKHGKGSGGE
jgi:hypothetical protein